ncbi:M13 family peptidase [Solimonas sp. K1W22B-7]|uniref:M13 family metallopeptidase n=1 Tax=Solimonas sp. K1W22B-7 TaxID=2303331 RepID=UPI000E330DDF|nr:M13-type metalloendopeptidase [Solimonas sp. K1W22B-7]AXQ31865.1 M13 family peptidase [Solimonas sp. K1W22B-7]
MKRLALAACAALLVAGCGSLPLFTGAPRGPVSGIDPENFDRKVRAQDDLYRAVSGGWMARTEIPADKASYGAFTEIDDRAEVLLRKIIEESAADKKAAAGSDTQKVGDYYRAFMDERRVNGLGLAPLRPTLAQIDALQDRRQLPKLLAGLSKIGAGPVPAWIDQDAKDSTRYIVYLEQGGTGLPDRDYYLSADAKFAEIRPKYVAHIAKMLTLAGIADAEATAQKIMALETTLARAQWTKVESRDDDKTYNLRTLAQLRKLTPRFDMRAYLTEQGLGATPGVVVRQPSFYKAWDKAMAELPLPLLRDYLKWQLLSDFAPYLSKDLVDENFAFYGTTLRGIQKLKPRWKRGVDVTEGALGEVTGRIYVARHFPPEAKARMQKLVETLLAAYGDSIRKLDWMSPQTKEKALLKLSKFTTKIGYPDKWKDYSALVVKPDDLLGNVMRSARVEHEREAAKLGKPIDRGEWFMTPQTVNAYYNPAMNEIVFPAAILQPPFFDMQADDAMNYGSIGAVIGHEIGHGFDDQGSKFDGDGNLKSWWTRADRARFEQRTKKLIEQYGRFEPVPGHKVNGELTIGENIGDLGGLAIAYKAWQTSLAGQPSPVIDGISGEQRFFMGWAQSWRRKYREADLVQRLKTDPHAPDEYRCNGVVVNLPAFYEAFGVKPGDRLYLPPEQRVSIW